MRRSVLLVVAAVLLAQSILAVAAATTGDQIVSYINAKRAASKIPAVKPSARWSVACAAHNNYEALNGGATVHSETPGNPGYTSDGAAVAPNAVLYQGQSWTATNNPFENAPIHIAQLLAPRLSHVGAAESGNLGCASTLVLRDRRAPKRKVTYTYPPDKATGWRSSELAAEGPYTPGQRRGIEAGATTGPYLLAMFDSPSMHWFSEAKVISATLTGPGGPVRIVVADNRTSGLQGFLPPGAYLIPRDPLTPATKYTAKVTAKIVGTKLKFVHQWSFTTQ